MSFEQPDTGGVSNRTEHMSEEMKKQFGYDLYPERQSAFKPTLGGLLRMSEGKEMGRRLRCEQMVYNNFLDSPIIKVMVGALKSSGCPVNLRRHFSCEMCDTSVHGGYDPELNQVVICHNTALSHGYVQGIMTHEMIHMFDACNHKFDFKNIEHVACSEIRAANMTHCSYLSGLIRNDFGFRLRKAHQDCVKKKAYLSVVAVRNVSKEEAVAVIDKVFDKCYNDLEPIGRRVKRDTQDMDLALDEAVLLGYV